MTKQGAYTWEVLRFGEPSEPPLVISYGHNILQATELAKAYLEKGETLGDLIDGPEEEV